MPVKKIKKDTVLYALISTVNKKKLAKLAKNCNMSISEYIDNLITELK